MRRWTSLSSRTISKAAFGKTVEEYKQHKGFETENLRDHMDDMELILTMLGEASTTQLTKTRDSRAFPDLKTDAKDGGDVAGTARKDIERKLGTSAVSSENYLDAPEGRERLGCKRSPSPL